jgi:hypothetical protein
MSDARIRVPGEMSKAFWNGYLAEAAQFTGPDFVKGPHCDYSGLKAAVRWLYDEMKINEGNAPMLGGSYQDGWNGAWRHLLRLFSAPASESPYDAIMDAALNSAPEEADGVKLYTASGILLAEAYRTHKPKVPQKIEDL